MATVKIIKNDAIVNIEIGAGFLQKLQTLYLSLVQQLTPEQIQMYNDCAENNKEFPDPIMDYVMTMTVLIKEIETKADEQGFISEQEISDTTQLDS